MTAEEDVYPSLTAKYRYLGSNPAEFSHAARIDAMPDLTVRWHQRA